MITTESAVIDCLVKAGYDIIEARSMLARHYDLFMDCCENQWEAQDTADEIIEQNEKGRDDFDDEGEEEDYECSDFADTE